MKAYFYIFIVFANLSVSACKPAAQTATDTKSVGVASENSDERYSLLWNERNNKIALCLNKNSNKNALGCDLFIREMTLEVFHEAFNDVLCINKITEVFDAKQKSIASETEELVTAAVQESIKRQVVDYLKKELSEGEQVVASIVSGVLEESINQAMVAIQEVMSKSISEAINIIEELRDDEYKSQLERHKLSFDNLVNEIKKRDETKIYSEGSQQHSALSKIVDVLRGKLSSEKACPVSFNIEHKTTIQVE